jgi:hypothetical protein
VTYVFLFEGGDLEEDWALEKLLPPHYGAEKAEQLLEEWLATLAPRERVDGRPRRVRRRADRLEHRACRGPLQQQAVVIRCCRCCTS